MKNQIKIRLYRSQLFVLDTYVTYFTFFTIFLAFFIGMKSSNASSEYHK